MRGSAKALDVGSIPTLAMFFAFLPVLRPLEKTGCCKHCHVRRLQILLPAAIRLIRDAVPCILPFNHVRSKASSAQATATSERGGVDTVYASGSVCRKNRSLTSAAFLAHVSQH